MNHKNFLLTLATASFTMPIIGLTNPHFVANHFDSKKTNNLSKSLSTDNIIDLKKINSIEDFLLRINSVTNVFMPESIINFSKPWRRVSNKISQESFTKLKEYTKNINFQYETIFIYFNNYVYEVDFKPIKKHIDIIKSKIDVDYDQVLSSAHSQKLIVDTLKKAPNMIAILTNMVGLKTVFQTSPLASIPDEGYYNYLDMLNAYHDFSWKISKSKAFSSWISQKKLSYKLMNQEHEIYYALPGQEYDKKQKPKMQDPKPNNTAQVHNLEAQLVLSLTNLYSLAN